MHWKNKLVIIPFCSFFFTKFTSLFDGIVFICSKFRQFEKSDIFECFKLLNTGERRGSVWCCDTEGARYSEWKVEVKQSSVLRGNTLCLNSLSVQLEWLSWPHIWLVTFKNGCLYFSIYMKLYNVKCFKEGGKQMFLSPLNSSQNKKNKRCKRLLCFFVWILHTQILKYDFVRMWSQKKRCIAKPWTRVQNNSKGTKYEQWI